MKIIFTLTQVNIGNSFDIQVSSEQRIKDTLKVLKENLPAFSELSEAPYIEEAEAGRRIDIEETYEQAHIYSGARLCIK